MNGTELTDQDREAGLEEGQAWTLQEEPTCLQGTFPPSSVPLEDAVHILRAQKKAPRLHALGPPGPQWGK